MGRIPEKQIQAIKQGVDLIGLMESKGIALRKNGKGYVGACPFHADKNPSLSVNLDTNLWQCFGCGAGGDVIRFVELFEKVSFSQAVKSLSGNNPEKTTRPAALGHAPDVKLLARVIAFYHTALCEDPRAREYLLGRGIKDNTLFSAYKLGYAGGTLLNAD